MYYDFFGFSESPFAIVPNPKFYFLSDRHKEALGHVLSGIQDGGGLALLTGEVGTGKTMTMKALLERLPENSEVAIILNPSLSVLELMQALCDGLSIAYQQDDGFKILYDTIEAKLRTNDDADIQTILLIDEAQHLMPDVLEQLRLLTNIETTRRKLLKVILIGQPELQQLLRQPQLRQLAQRITARYHLLPLVTAEVKQYISHRLSCVGGLERIFDSSAIKVIASETGGVPRLVNLVCDQALKLACHQGMRKVGRPLAKQACKDVLDWQGAGQQGVGKIWWPHYVAAIGGAALLAISIRAVFYYWPADTGLVAPAGNAAAEIAQRRDIPAMIEDKDTVKVVVASEPESAPQAALTQPSPGSPATAESETVDLAGSGLQAFEGEGLDVNELAGAGSIAGTAMQTLYLLWGYQAELLDAGCTAPARGGLSCLEAELPLETLLKHNRPAVLELETADGQPWFAVLSGAGETSRELLAAGQRIAVGNEWLEQHWTGRSLVLWRPPQGQPGTIRYGQRGEKVRWLDTRLNLILGNTSKASSRFGDQLLGKVKRFQRSQQLDADGIAGPLTMMMVDSVLELPGPQLAQTASLDAAKQQALASGRLVGLAYPVLSGEPLPVELASSVEEATSYGGRGQQSGGKGQEQLSGEALDEEFKLENLDLSGLSPELAKKVKTAMGSDKSRTLEAKLERTAPQSNVVPIGELPGPVLNRLPAMDFQAHIYASNVTDRRVKVNGRNAAEGEFVAEGVLLRGIEPRQVVVQFEDKLIAIPALTEW